MLATTYNAATVAAVRSVADQLPEGRRIGALEVGAGTGGTAAQVLPVLAPACDRYIFTDVSDFFLRQAARRFGSFACFEAALLNIDADPRLQGFASHELDLGEEPLEGEAPRGGGEQRLAQQLERHLEPGAREPVL